MHGTKDLTVPFAQGEGLARALPRAEFWRTAWTHNNWSMDVTYWGHIKAFLQKYALLTLPAIPDSSTENN